MVDNTTIRHWIIYMYTFPNEKRYIGKTNRTLAQRQGSNFKRYKNSTLLWNAIQKYGVENIQQDILFEGNITDLEADEKEREYILKYKTNANRFKNPAYGYNLTDGGEGVIGWHPQGEDLKRRQEQMRQNGINNRGKIVSEETRKKQSLAKKGRKNGPMSEETKRKISEANSDKNISKETRIRKSVAQSPWYIVTFAETGKTKTFYNVKEAWFNLGISPTTIRRKARNHEKDQYGNIIESYIPTETERERLLKELIS